MMASGKTGPAVPLISPGYSGPVHGGRLSLANQIPA